MRRTIFIRGKAVHDWKEAKLRCQMSVRWNVRVVKVFDRWGYIVTDITNPKHWYSSDTPFQSEATARLEALDFIENRKH